MPKTKRRAKKAAKVLKPSDFQWERKHSDMWWGPCGFVIEIGEGHFGECHLVLIGGKAIQFCSDLKSAKEYIVAFIQKCVDAATEAQK